MSSLRRPEFGWLLGVAGILILSLSGCGENGPEPGPASISLSATSISFSAIGQTQQLSPTVTDQQGNTLPDASVSWNSSNPAVATVTSTGLVTAQGMGLAEVTATAGAASAVAQVAVAQAPNQLQKLSGDGQVGIAGQPLPSPLVVEVDDAQGNPVSGATVTFVVTQGGGSLGTPTAITDPDGRAATTFTPGLVAGAPQLVAASVATASVSAVFTATATPGPPATVDIAAGHNQQAAPGSEVPTPPAVLVRDVNDNPVPGVPVTFEVISGGGSITGGATTTNNVGIAQVGSWMLGSAGPNELQATAAGAGISGNPVSFMASPNGSSFDILVRFVGRVTASQRQAVSQAQARWEALITQDLDNVQLRVAAGGCGEESPAVDDTIDDLMIFVMLVPIDGPGGVLGSAGPCFLRNSSNLTALGAMRFDSADLEEIEAAGLLETVIVHEMGHVLGFGSLWGLQGLLADPSLPENDSVQTDPHFTGAQAITAFNEVGGAAYIGAKVPVEDTGGKGTADGHWRESVFSNELMTGFVDAGQNPLSKVTLASLADQGYAVNIGGAEPYSLTLALRGTRALPRLALGNDVLHLPVKKVDASGRIVEVLRR